MHVACPRPPTTELWRRTGTSVGPDSSRPTHFADTGYKLTGRILGGSNGIRRRESALFSTWEVAQRLPPTWHTHLISGDASVQARLTTSCSAWNFPYPACKWSRSVSGER